MFDVSVFDSGANEWRSLMAAEWRRPEEMSARYYAKLEMYLHELELQVHFINLID